MEISGGFSLQEFGNVRAEIATVKAKRMRAIGSGMSWESTAVDCRRIGRCGNVRGIEMGPVNRHLSRAADLFARFKDDLVRDDRLEYLAAELIGNDAEIHGPFGPRPLVYADYVASGRAISAIERFVLEKVLPFYANSHTEASYCGGFMTGLRIAARNLIGRCCGADESCAVIFTGAGATAGLNRLVNLFGVEASLSNGVTPRVVTGPYEHHSNILPWRESGAEVVAIAEAAFGGPDLDQLDAAIAAANGRLVICALSAASNVTGIVSTSPPLPGG